VEYVRRRMRDTHDLWHAVLGYRGDLLGEAALLAFAFAQTGNAAMGALTGLGLAMFPEREARRLIVGGFGRGRSAAWFPAQPWELLLALPVDDVRRRLGVAAPPRYTPIRSSTLRDAGRLPAVRVSCA
ncbi:MAG TPA: Coq4 family protein, partial [Kofleriaceae bacterium]|nr:Coq4 family protein [Kofleriaceae bacterium]